MLRWQLGPTQMKCTCNANDSIYITLCFFNQHLINLGSYLLIMETFSQNSIFMSDKKMIENFPRQDPLHFLPKSKPKTHSVISHMVREQRLNILKLIHSKIHVFSDIKMGAGGRPLMPRLYTQFYKATNKRKNVKNVKF